MFRSLGMVAEVSEGVRNAAACSGELRGKTAVALEVRKTDRV
jgi:hypothetical protein